jgi:aminomethyltransferase
MGAKLIEFGGFEMPVQYEGILAEHRAVRQGVGVFDVSHMGEFFVRGKQATEFLQRVLTNDLSQLDAGRAQYNLMLYEGHHDFPDGGTVDDLIVYCIAPEEYLLIVNASNIDKDFAWLDSHRLPYVSLTNRSDELSLLAVQGQYAEATLQPLTDAVLSDVKYYRFIKTVLAGVEMFVARTGYTGEDGFEICFENAHADKIWNALFEAGKKFGIKPIGLGARDTLRLEMGYALYGHELDERTNPIEAGLGWATKLSKSAFNGKTACANAKASPTRRLVGFELSGRSIARQGFEICTADGEKIGEVRSGTLSPSLEQPIGTGYVEAAYSAVGSKIFVKIRERLEEATIVKPPFLKKERAAAVF